MRVERAVQRQQLRFRLVLESADSHTHSDMSEVSEWYQRLLDPVSELIVQRLERARRRNGGDGPRRIELALELPAVLYSELLPDTDLDFALTHQVLEDPAYAENYLTRPKGRELILDNSMFELGTALTVNEVIEAAQRVHADFVVSPDRLGDAEWTLSQYKLLKEKLPPGIQKAVVLVGDSYSSRLRLLQEVRDAEMLCLSFLGPRVVWFLEHFPLHFKRIHLLGVPELGELRFWTELAAAHPEIKFTTDTSKPVKHGLLGTRLYQGGSVRGTGIATADLLRRSAVSPEELQQIRENVSLLKDLLTLPEPSEL